MEGEAKAGGSEFQGKERRNGGREWEGEGGRAGGRGGEERKEKKNFRQIPLNSVYLRKKKKETNQAVL